MDEGWNRYFEQGRQAFAAGQRRIVPRDLLVGQGAWAAEQWYFGWDAANLAAPVPGVDDDLVEHLRTQALEELTVEGSW